MPGPTTTLLIEGSFEELADELAQYIDSLKKTQGDESSTLQAECEEVLKDNQKDEALKKLVMGSQVLNQAPEKGMQTCESFATTIANKVPRRVHSGIQPPHPPRAAVAQCGHVSP
jgi:hypothetical protein